MPALDQRAGASRVDLARALGRHSYRLPAAPIQAYRTGDLVHVYPIARGAAPLITAIGTLLLIGESIGTAGFLGVGALSFGVFLMSIRGGRLATFDRRAVGFALGSAVATASYSLVDGIGARINGSGPSFALWMFVGNMLVMQAFALAVKGPAIYRTLPATWPMVLAGGLMSMLAYFIVIWAMTQAPIALVAALRETSVLFAGLISLLILKEPLRAGAGLPPSSSSRAWRCYAWRSYFTRVQVSVLHRITAVQPARSSASLLLTVMVPL